MESLPDPVTKVRIRRKRRRSIWTESSVQKQVLRYLVLRKIPAWRVNSTGVWDPIKHHFRPGTSKGISDIVALLPPLGTFMAIECKSISGKARPEQAVFLERVREAGGVGMVARSVDDVEWALDQLRSGASPRDLPVDPLINRRRCTRGGKMVLWQRSRLLTELMAGKDRE